MAPEIDGCVNRFCVAKVRVADRGKPQRGSNEQRPSRRPIFPPTRRGPPVLPAGGCHRASVRAAAGGGGNAGRRAARSIAFWSALAGSAALAFPLGHDTEVARHPKLSLPRIA